jgi:uncharacterized membrane protein YqjE
MRESTKPEASDSLFGQRAEVSGGLLASLRTLLLTLLETVQVRLELFGTELEAEKRRILDALLFSALALVCVALGLALLCGAVVLMFPDQMRFVAAGAIAVFFLAAGFGLVALARRRLHHPLGMFHATAQELARDREKA